MTYDDRRPAIGFFVSFRSYGTWLHGDARGSFDRTRNIYGEAGIAPEPRWRAYETRALRCPPVRLDRARRHATQRAIEETCAKRGWVLHAVNVRTNHAHTVVSAPTRVETVLGAFKANATRLMRVEGRWSAATSPWSSGGSTRYLWTDWDLDRAINYVLYGQGPALD